MPIMKVTDPVGEEVYPSLTAEKLVVVAGQNHDDDVHVGNSVDDGDVKNRPFEPVSRKL